jgi:hypothetical protein
VCHFLDAPKEAKGEVAGDLAGLGVGEDVEAFEPRARGQRLRPDGCPALTENEKGPIRKDRAFF